MHPHRNKIGAFTLIEVLITVLIVSLLASIAVPMTEVVIKRNKEQTLRSSLREIRTAIDAYKQAGEDGKINVAPNESGYPHTLDVLVSGIADKNDQKKKWFFLRRIPQDPFSTDSSLSASENWGLRSYASDASDPKAGEDVFDVYSKSTSEGLNGIPYKQW